MPELDHYGGYLISAFLVTFVVLVGYGLYLRSRLLAARRRLAASGYSARKVNAAAPMVTTAQPANSANGPSPP